MPVIATTAKDLFVETIQNRPELFMSGAWYSLNNFRDSVLHPFDRRRLELSYHSPGEAWTALKHAIDTIPWVETRGAGLDMEFRVRHIPSAQPTTLPDALVLIEHYKKALDTWKDAGFDLLELTALNNALTVSMEAAEWRLYRAGAMIHFYRTMAETFAADIEAMSGKKREVRTPSPFDLEGIVSNPSAFGKVSQLLDSVGLLTPEKLEDHAAKE